MIALWLYFAIWIESSGRLTVQNNTSAQYVKDNTMQFTRWYNLMALFWSLQFLIGCQHMAIAGAVAIWYFSRYTTKVTISIYGIYFSTDLISPFFFFSSRNKNEIDSPITTSFSNLIRFHLGTVCLGSLLIAIIQMIRALLSVFEVI